MSYNPFVSKWHKVFVELGYPQLDVRFVSNHDKKKRFWGHETGEWAIYELLNSPACAHDVNQHWRDVLTGLKNMEITRSKLKTFAESIDTKKQAIWDREYNKTKAVEDEFVAREKHEIESAERKTKAIVQNPDLLNRIVKNGIAEIDPYRIYKRIPHYRW